jgi:hypothetical protein
VIKTLKPQSDKPVWTDIWTWECRIQRGGDTYSSEIVVDIYVGCIESKDLLVLKKNKLIHFLNLLYITADLESIPA